MKILRRVHRWFYLRLKGHLPVGTLVRLSPKGPGRAAVLAKLGQRPSFDVVGISIGGWRYYRSPGYTDFGTLVMFGTVTYDAYEWDLEVIDEAG